MQGCPLWPVRTRFPKLVRNINADVTIVGGGITGIFSAFSLQGAGYDVIVIERDEVGSPASGASSGILYYGSGTNFQDATELFGEGNASLLWNESRETMNLIANTVTKNDLDCGFRSPGSIMVGKTQQEVDYLEREHASLKKIGIHTEIFNTLEIAKHFTGREFPKGLHFPECSQIRPSVFAASLATHFDLKVFEDTPYLSFEEKETSIVVKTPEANINSVKLIFTTNLKPVFGLERFFQRESSVIIASKELSDEQIRRIWPSEKIIWSIGRYYDIIYPVGKRLILELFRFQNVQEKASYYYPRNFTIDKKWGDSWSKGVDWLPIIGGVKENIFVAVAMGDQGIVMGCTAGRKMPRLIEGSSDEFLALCSTKRFAQTLL